MQAWYPPGALRWQRGAPAAGRTSLRGRLQWDAAAFKMIAAKAAEQNQTAKMQIRAVAQRL